MNNGITGGWRHIQRDELDSMSPTCQQVNFMSYMDQSRFHIPYRPFLPMLEPGMRHGRSLCLSMNVIQQVTAKLTEKKFLVSRLVCFAKPPVCLQDNVLEIAENVDSPVRIR
jgi:hypothetical protein